MWLALTLISSPAFPPNPSPLSEGVVRRLGARQVRILSGRCSPDLSLGFSGIAWPPGWRKRPRNTERDVVSQFPEDHPDPGIFLVLSTLSGLADHSEILRDTQAQEGQIRVHTGWSLLPAADALTSLSPPRSRDAGWALQWLRTDLALQAGSSCALGDGRYNTRCLH